MKRPVSLTAHRNKVEARRKRELAKDIERQVSGLVKERDIRAYGFVGIASDGKAYALWDTGGAIPMRVLPHVFGQALSDDIFNSGVEDDWRPALPVKPAP